MAAAAALGGPAVMGMLGGGTAASGIAGAGAGLLGASDATAALAGDAFMPAALGTNGVGEPSMGSLLGSKLASSGSTGMSNGKMFAARQGLGLLNQRPVSMAPMGPPPSQPVTSTNVNAQAQPEASQLIAMGVPPEIANGDPQMLRMWFQQHQRGVS